MSVLTRTNERAEGAPIDQTDIVRLKLGDITHIVVVLDHLSPERIFNNAGALTSDALLELIVLNRLLNLVM